MSPRQLLQKNGSSPDAELWAVTSQILLALLVFCCWPYFVMPILCGTTFLHYQDHIGSRLMGLLQKVSSRPVIIAWKGFEKTKGRVEGAVMFTTAFWNFTFVLISRGSYKKNICAAPLCTFFSIDVIALSISVAIE